MSVSKLFLVFVMAFAVIGVAAFSVVQMTGLGDKDDKPIETIPVAGEIILSSLDVEFKFDAKDSSAQDDVDDIDIDVFVYDETKNEELKNTKHYLDCDGAVPMVIDIGVDSSVTVTKASMCKLNTYKMYQSFTVADVETYTDDYLQKAEFDMGAVGNDDTPTGGSEETLDVDTVFLVIANDLSEDSDMNVLAFLFKISKTTKMDATIASTFIDGTKNIRISHSYYSDARAEGKLTIGGTCTDSDGYDPVLTTSLDGVVHSTQTTEVELDYDCTVWAEINKDGYSLTMENPLANGISEQSYVVFSPYGENATGVWGEYGTNADFTGNVAYSTTNSTSNEMIFLATACGNTLIDSSSTDSVQKGNERIYQSEAGTCLMNAYDKGGRVTLDIHIDNVDVDYDASVTSGNHIVDASSGSSGESFFDIDLIGLVDTSDIIAQTISG